MLQLSTRTANDSSITARIAMIAQGGHTLFVNLRARSSR